MVKKFVFWVVFEGFPSKYMSLAATPVIHKGPSFFLLSSYLASLSNPVPDSLRAILTRQREGWLRESLGLFQFIPCRYGLFMYDLQYGTIRSQKWGANRSLNVVTRLSHNNELRKSLFLYLHCEKAKCQCINLLKIWNTKIRKSFIIFCIICWLLLSGIKSRRRRND